MIDLYIDLVAIGVLFGSKLVSNQRVSLSYPPEVRDIQTVGS